MPSTRSGVNFRLFVTCVYLSVVASRNPRWFMLYPSLTFTVAVLLPLGVAVNWLKRNIRWGGGGGWGGSGGMGRVGGGGGGGGGCAGWGGGGDTVQLHGK